MIYHLSDSDVHWDIEAHPDSIIGSRIAQTNKPYEWPMLHHIRSIGWEPDSVAVDVGAHIGNHTLYFAKVLGMRVHAFEPIFFPELLDNVERNELEDRVKIYGYALGDVVGVAGDSGERVMDPEGTPLRTKAGAGQGRLVKGQGDIVVRPLDELELNDVAMMKLDIEGWEPWALAGARKTIERCQPMIYAEAATTAASRRIRNVLEPLGYHRTNRFPRGTSRDEWSPR